MGTEVPICDEAPWEAPNSESNASGRAACHGKETVVDLQLTLVMRQ